MKLLYAIVLTVILALGIAYIYLHRQELGFGGPRETPRESQAASGFGRWTKVDRSGEGFKVEMPAEARQTEAPARNEHGGEEAVEMIVSSPGGETTFSVAWADHPPVARVAGSNPAHMLELARDGAVESTQTTVMRDAARSTQGFPGREFTARNANGGILDSRLIYAGGRLYMLMAAYPSQSSRREQDVARFFNSFSIALAPGMGGQEAGN